LVDLLVALTRLPNLETPSLRAAVAASLGFDLKLLLDAPGQRLSHPFLATHADAIEHIDKTCREFVDELSKHDFQISTSDVQRSTSEIYQVLTFISEKLVPNLRLSQREEV